MAKKKRKKATRKNNDRAVPVSGGSISVTLKRARNGYVVSSYSDPLKKEIIYIAKTRAEAKEHMDKLLRGK